MKKGLFQGSKKTYFLTETMIAIIVLFSFAVITLLMYNVYDDVNTDIQNSNDFNADTKLELNTWYGRFNENTDGMFLMISVFILIVVLVTAWFSYDYPILIIVLIIMLIALIIVGAILSNAWAELASDTEFATLAANLPITSNVLNNFVMYVLVLMGSAGIVLFMRSR